LNAPRHLLDGHDCADAAQGSVGCWSIAIEPPTFDAAAAVELATGIDAALAVGMPTATVDASAILSLQASLGDLNALLAIGAVLGVSGIHLYMVTGTAPDMAGELSTDLAPGFPGALPESTGIGFLLAASSGPAQTALQAVITIR
jgi:hypothetical protein